MKSAKYGYEIKTDKKGIDALYKRLQDLNQKEIQYGYFEDNRYPTDGSDRSNMPVATIAMKHESGWFGRLGYVPPRPFFTQSLAKAQWIVKEFAPEIYKLSFTGKLEKTMITVAGWLKESVQDSIDEQNFAPLSQETIDAKGHSTILVESGQMRDSVQAKIVNSNAYGTRKKEVDVK